MQAGGLRAWGRLDRDVPRPRFCAPPDRGYHAEPPDGQTGVGHWASRSPGHGGRPTVDEATRPVTRAACRDYQMMQVMAADPFPAAGMEALAFQVVAELES